MAVRRCAPCLLVLACMVFARTAAMLFNRLADWSLDQRNPRTATRHLLVDKTTAVALLVVFSRGLHPECGAPSTASTGLLSPGRTSDRLLLFAHETLHHCQSFFPRPRSGRRAGRSVDRATRPARLAAAGSRCRSHLLGGGFRSHLCDAGFRVRSTRRFALVSRDARDRAQPAPRAVAASPDVRGPARVWFRLRRSVRSISARCR